MNCQPPIPDPAPGDGVTVGWGRSIARAIRSMRLSGGPGVSVRTTPAGTTVSVPRPRDERGGDGVEVKVVTPTTPDPDNPGEYLPAYKANARVVADWMYDETDHCYKVLYGTLAVIGGELAIVVDVDANDQPLWRSASNAGPFGGGGVQAYEENY